MAKKTKTRKRSQSKRQQARQAQQQQAQQRQRRQRIMLGGAVLALVIGIGVFVRYRQMSHMPMQLQGASDHHYTHGTAGAPVVIKEFSDYT
jgi:flagellar biosynthesis/type III secretory pathway M-ring protein FliF/YscJ